MRLLVLTNAYPPDSMGGYELICQDYVAELRARGHRVVVVTTRSDQLQPDEVAGGAAGEEVLRLLDFHWAAFSHERPSGFSLLRGERRQRRLLERIIADHRLEAALVWGMAAVSKSLLGVLDARGLPMVTIVEEHWPIWDITGDAWLAAWRRPRHPLLAVLRSAAAPLASRLIAPTDVGRALRAMVPLYCSQYMRSAVDAAVPELAGRGIVSLNGVRGDLFSTTREDSEPLQTPLRMLYAGRVERRKGVRTGIEALAALKRRKVAATLTIAGWKDDEYVVELRQLADSHGIAGDITWGDALSREQMPGLYREHDVFLFPTLWDEPFGLAPLEAMACGCVVLATGTGGSAEFLIDHRSALLFEREDSEALADLVTQLIKSPELVVALRRGGGQMAAELTFDAFAKRLDSALEVKMMARDRPR